MHSTPFWGTIVLGVLLYPIGGIIVPPRGEYGVYAIYSNIPYPSFHHKMLYVCGGWGEWG